MCVLLSFLLMWPDIPSKRNVAEKRVYVAHDFRLRFLIAAKSVKAESGR